MARGGRVSSPSGPDFPRLILEALVEAGGSMQRSNLRDRIRPVIKTADFDRAIAELIGKRLIVAERSMLYWHSPRGCDIPYHVTIYRLASRPDPRG